MLCSLGRTIPRSHQQGVTDECIMVLLLNILNEIKYLNAALSKATSAGYLLVSREENSGWKQKRPSTQRRSDRSWRLIHMPSF